jgi:hypothetical protein
VPYLDNKIDKHRINCVNPVGKRLYIRDYDNKGKQRFVSWGLTCTTCGVVIKEKYYPNLTPKQLEYREFDKKLEGSEQNKRVGQLGGNTRSWEEKFERNQKYRIANKFRRLRRKKLGAEPITPRESGLRTRIRNLKRYYEWATHYWIQKIRSLDGKKEIESIRKIWDDVLVNEFLNVSPRPTITELSEVFASPDFIIRVDSRSKLTYLGCVPVPAPSQKRKELIRDIIQRRKSYHRWLPYHWLTYNEEAYINLLKSEAQKRKELMRDIIQERNKRFKCKI